MEEEKLIKERSSLIIKRQIIALSATFYSNPVLLGEILVLPLEYTLSIYSQEIIRGPQAYFIKTAEEQFKKDQKVRSERFQKAIRWSIAFPVTSFNSSESNICYKNETGATDKTLTSYRKYQIRACKSYSLRYASEKNGYSLHETIGKWFSAAMMGLSARDMVSDKRSPFSEKDYLRLTVAYRFFFGKIHPDDEKIESLDEVYIALGATPLPTDPPV